ncbi:MAG: Na+ dependent nucleoside transporter N-terminal domain-containing protein [Acidobacteriota bacterium]
MFLQSLLGILVILSLAWLLSEHRWKVSWRLVLTGLALQAAIAVFLLKVPISQRVFLSLNHVVMALDESTQARTRELEDRRTGARSSGELYAVI